MVRTLLILILTVLAAHGAGAQGLVWKRAAGPYGGVIRTIAAAGNRAFVGTDYGIYRSLDGGERWERVGASIFSAPVEYLAVTDGAVVAALGVLLFRSSDNGVTWTNVHTMPNAVIGLYTVGGDIYAASALDRVPGDTTKSGSVARSTDGGRTWSAVTGAGGLPAGQLFSMARGGGALYAAMNRGLFRSSDDGATWARVGAAIGPGRGMLNVVADDSAVVAEWWGEGFHRSTDGGSGWERDERWPTASHRVARGGGAFFVVNWSTNAVLRSTDHGRTWDTVHRSDKAGRTFRSVAAAGEEAGPIFVGGDGEGVYRSLDAGGTWARSVAGLDACSVLGFARFGDGMVAAVKGGLHLSRDDGATWNDISGDLAGLNVESVVALGPVLFAGTRSDGMFRSVDSGRTWEDLDDRIGRAVIVTDIAVSAGRVLMRGSALTPKNLYLSTNGGETWKPLGEEFVYGRDGAVAMAGDTLYATVPDGVIVSRDRGATWDRYCDLPNLPYRTSLSLAGSRLYLVTDGALWAVDDGGRAVRDLRQDSNAEFRAGPAVAVEPEGDHAFVGDELGQVFRMEPDARWVRLSGGRLPARIGALARSGGWLMAGLQDGGGVHRALLVPAAAPADRSGTAALPAACFPNPASGAAVLRLRLPEPAAVRVTLYDARGVPRLELPAVRLEAGDRNIPLPLGDLPAGLYLYRVSAGTLTATGGVDVVR